MTPEDILAAPPPRPPRWRAFVREHQKTLGIAALLFGMILFVGSQQSAFWATDNLRDLLRYTGLYGILSLAAAFVIVTGGIDLSMGSLIGLSGVLLPMLLRAGGLFYGGPVSVPVAFITILSVSAVIGLVHGLLITKLNLKPFLVTLCGLFIYRGLARWVAKDESWGFESGFTALRELTEGLVLDAIPVPFVVLVIFALAASLFLHRTIWGRRILALGSNEQAARFSGVATDRLKIVCYVLCSVIGGFGGCMFALATNSVLPSNFGTSYELYAIAGAVLGGCSLRGGECRFAGVILGAAMVQVTNSASTFLDVPDSLKFAVIGSLILLGVIADEMLRRWSVRHPH